MADLGLTVGLIKALAPKPDAATIEGAVSDWLDDHPEATTTVQDGSITKAKLHSDLADELDDKAPSIVVKTEKKNKFTKEETAIKHSGAAYVDGEPGEDVVIGFAENIMPDINDEIIEIGDTFTGTAHRNGVVEFSGYVESTNLLYLHKYGSTTETNIPLQNEIESGNVITFCAYVKGSIIKTGDTSPSITSSVYFKYNDGTSSGEVIRMTTNEGLNIRSFTIPDGKTADKVVICFTIRSGWDYDCSVSCGLLLNGEWILNTIPSSGTMKFNKEQIANGFTSLPYKSYLEYIADTKDYVDGYLPDGVVTFDDLQAYEPTLQNLHFLTPEMFGAVGDGNADDTVALQACIDYGITNMIPVRGYGIYKTTSKITFAQYSAPSGKNYSYEINGLVYNGADEYAIEINGSCGRFIFGSISSQRKGIYLRSIVNGATYNYIFANRLYCVEDAFTTYGESGGVHYNTVRIMTVTSTTGNCFVNGINSGENRYYDSSCHCQNGWAIYGMNGRYYNFGMEADVKNGIYTATGDAANAFGFRWAELVDNYEAGVKGTVLKVVGEGVHVRIIGPEIPIGRIDVSEMYTVDHVSSSVYKAKGLILTAPLVSNDSRIKLSNETYIRCGKIIGTPVELSNYTVTTTLLDLRGNNPVGYPTRFQIDATDCEIHLSDSYCCIGYNTIIIDQSINGKTCTIYKSDDDVTPIFDGSLLGNGIYRLTAYCEGDSQNSIIYLTNNDVWFVEKIS